MKKALYINPNLYHLLCTKSSEDILKEKPFLQYRKSILLPKFVGLMLYVHNGKEYLKVHVSDSMIGHKLGEFSGTRCRYFFKSKKIKQKQKNKK